MSFTHSLTLPCMHPSTCQRPPMHSSVARPLTHPCIHPFFPSSRVHSLQPGRLSMASRVYLNEKGEDLSHTGKPLEPGLLSTTQLATNVASERPTQLTKALRKGIEKSDQARSRTSLRATHSRAHTCTIPPLVICSSCRVLALRVIPLVQHVLCVPSFSVLRCVP